MFLKLLGGSYLIYLGLKLMAARSHQRSAPRVAGPANHHPGGSYRLGLLTNLSNPKTAAFVASIFAATLPSDASYSTGFVSVALMAGISTIWYSSVAWIFSMSRFRQTYQKAKIWIERVAGVIFAGFGVKLITTE